MKTTAKQISLFVAVATQGSVSKAAEFLHLTQAAASMGLAELESQLGISLFDRLGKKLCINQMGITLLPKALEILNAFQEFEDLAKSPKALAGELKIGASTTIANYLLAKIISHFVQVYPMVRVSLQVGNTEQIIEKMRHFQLDIGLIEGVCQNSELSADIWQQDELVCFVSANHPLAQNELISIDELKSAKWILREKGSGTRDIFERAIYAKLPQLSVILELGSPEAIKQAILSSEAIGCLSLLTLQTELANGSLKRLIIPELNMKRDLLLLTQPVKSESSLVKAFKAFSNTQKPEKPKIKLKPIIT